jgi:leader peptidase (prepilin peptidase)/N-methyltransferase
LDNPFIVQELWQEYPRAFLGAVALLALIVGSFLNVVILRLPVMMDRAWRSECRTMLAEPPLQSGHGDEPVSLAYPPSTCPGCGHRIRPWENLPVLSWLVLGGRCSACGIRISIRYPAVELLSCALSVAIAWRFGAQWSTVAALVFTWALIALSLIDIDHQLLPDDITLPLLWAGLLLNSQGVFVPLQDAIWGAAGGYLCLWSVYWAFRLATGKEGMGFGDFKLLAALGAWLGWQALPVVVVVSSACGAFIGLGLILLRGRDRNVPIPFGPYLAMAGWLTLMWGESLPRPFA